MNSAISSKLPEPLCLYRPGQYPMTSNYRSIRKNPSFNKAIIVYDPKLNNYYLAAVNVL